MSTLEERITELEERVSNVQTDASLSRADNSRILAVLNRVVTTQELNYRELGENQTMLAGIISTQGIDIKSIKSRLDSIDARFDRLEMMLSQILARLPNPPTT